MLASSKKKFIVDVKRALRLGALLIFIASFCCYSVMLAEFAKFSENPRPSNGETLQQPFLKGTGGSDNFRIPAMVTLDDGSIITAADARPKNIII